MYTPLTERGIRYRNMGYWFASGIWFEQSRTRQVWTPDRSQEFGDYCAERADEFDTGAVSSLSSMLDMWREFSSEIVFAAPDPASALTADQCERAGVDPTLRSQP